MRVGNKRLEDRKNALIEQLRRYPNLGIAFSGGVDSSLLLAMAHQVHGEGVTAITARSSIHPSGEMEAAISIARRLGVRHLIVDTRELEDPAFVHNDKMRCYYCKLNLFRVMGDLSRKEGIAVLAHGANADDLADYRPGFQASQEMGVVAPLVDAGLTKTMIRELARLMGLDNWNRPAMACLATRIPYGVPIDSPLLKRIDTAEGVLRDMGFTICRVRHHGQVARIEVDPSQLSMLMQAGPRKKIINDFHQLGYHHIAVDLEGYVSGKMNRDIRTRVSLD